MEQKLKKENKKSINVNEYSVDTKFLIILIFSLVGALIMSTTYIFKEAVITNDHFEQDIVYKQETNELMQVSDYLTTRVYFYVSTGDPKYYNEYITMLEEARASGLTVDTLLGYSQTEEEKRLLNETKQIVKELGTIESQAFELVRQGNILEARKLIFSNEYVSYKDQLQLNSNLIKDSITARFGDESDRILSLSAITLTITIVVGIGTAIALCILLFTLFKIRKESNIDLLTGLQNRNNYLEDIELLINNDKDKFGALLFCDIDNLKFINDCYGHNSGDRYIQATANILKEFGVYKSVIARPSGDEFVVYIHGFDSKDEMVEIITEKMNLTKNSYFTISMHIEEKVRFSTGIAVYPTDTKKVDELIKFADYAMYKMKKNSKGSVAYYDSTTLDKTLFLARNSGYLDEFLDKELLDFALQPMVDANTFEICGYEALMRPQSDIISTPYLLLELAKAESKLDKIERLVMKKVFEKINENMDVLKDYKIFVNSIADQILTDDEFKVYEEQYPDILSNMVIEVTEQETVDYDLLRVKSNMFKNVGALLAIDDFGAGYSNENSLLSNDYDIIKLDMNLIRNIDTDVRRQQIVTSIINFSNAHDYKILAEGVETENEVRTLRELGIHYMQGYYFGKPDLEIKGVTEKAKKFLEAENIKAQDV